MLLEKKVNVEMLRGRERERERETKFSYFVREERSKAICDSTAWQKCRYGRGEEELRCNSLFIVCQRRRGRGLSEDEYVGIILLFGRDAKIRLWQRSRRHLKEDQSTAE